MKTKTLFFSSLIAAAAMSTVPVFADYTWNAENTTITQELWQTQDSWSLSGSSWTGTGTGPGTPNSNMWDKIVVAGTDETKVSGSINTLEGWALKLELKNADLTVGQLKKLQSNSSCSISLDKNSVLAISNFGPSGNNDGNSVTLTNEGTFNLTLGKNQGGAGFKADLGSTGVFNISGAYSASITTLSAKLGNGSSDYVNNIVNGNTIYTRNLVNLSDSATLANTATYSFTDKDGATLSAVDSLAALTGTDKYFVVKDSSGYRVSYLVSGVSDQVYSWNASASSSWSDAVWKNGESAGQSIADTSVAYLGADGTSKTITIGSATTVARLIVDGDYTLSGAGSLTMTNGGIINSGKTLILTKSTGGTGFLCGALEVAGTLQLNDTDISGYNGGSTSLHTITVDAGGVLKLNHSKNETFAGTLNLNGTLSGKDSDTRWDMFGSSSQINVAENASAEINKNIRVIIRRDNAPINVGSGATLTINGQVLKSSEAGSSLGGNGVLVKNGAGELKLNGKVVLEQLTVNAGTATISGTVSDTIGTLYSGACTVNIGDETNATTVSSTRVEIGDSNGGTSTLNIKKNATLAITGSNNDTGDKSYKNASLLLSEWNNTTTANISGTLLAKDAKLLRGDVATTLNVSGGTLAVKGFYATKNSGNAVTVNVSDSGKLILGSGDVSGINSVNVSLNNGTFAASESTITFSKNIALNGAGTIDTTKYDFADDGKSIARGTTAAAITLAGVISGSEALTITGAGTLTLSGENTALSSNLSVESGATLVANNASALGTGKTTVASGAKLGLIADTTVADVTGGITLASGAKIVVDMSSKASEAETFVLDLITGTALTYNSTLVSSTNVSTLLTDGVIELSNWNKDGWVKSLTFDDSAKKLSLTMTIPEPSAFGLLAGVGALVFVAARRRRRAK